MDSPYPNSFPPEHLQNHYSTKLKDGLSSETVSFHHSVLHVALETALKWGLIARNPANAVNLLRVRRKDMKIWDEEEMARFLDVAKNCPFHRYEAVTVTLSPLDRRGLDLLPDICQS